MRVDRFAMLLVALGCLFVATLGYAQPRGMGPPPMNAESADLLAARAVVEKYWSSSAEAAYELLSSDYKDRLRKANGIATANAYRIATADPERIWRKQTYQRATLVRPSAIRITVLADWEQDGYEGIMTFVFDLVKSPESWRIANIVH